MVIAERGERNDFGSAFPGFFPVCPLCLLKVTDREKEGRRGAFLFPPDLLSRSAVYSLRGSLRQSIAALKEWDKEIFNLIKLHTQFE